ncbi:MAG: hypothetical protein WD072_02195, partial [Pirellulales bacterium]
MSRVLAALANVPDRARPRRLPPAARAYPVGRLVSGEHVADFSDAAICTTPDGEPPFDLAEKDPRQGRHGLGPVSKES